MNFNKAKKQVEALGFVAAVSAGPRPRLPQCPNNQNFVTLQDPGAGEEVRPAARHALHGRGGAEPVRRPRSLTVASATWPGHDIAYVHEDFTEDERATLAPFFSDLDGPGLRAHEHARGREGRDVRPLLADHEVAPAAVPGRVRAGHRGAATHGPTVASTKAAGLYERIFVEYGDDSVAQLGGVHLACEQASQLLAKALEWGRLAAYLEQSTRYMRYDDRPGGRVARHRPARAGGHAARRAVRRAASTSCSGPTAGCTSRSTRTGGRAIPQGPATRDFIYRQSIMAKTCDTLRVLLPGGHPVEPRDLRERPVLRAAADAPGGAPAGRDARLRRADARRAPEGDPGVPHARRRGGARRRVGRATGRTCASGPRSSPAKLVGDVEPEPRPMVNLVDHDPDGELKVTAAVLYAASRLPDDQLLDVVRGDDARGARRGAGRDASASAGTGGTSRAARGSAPATGSTSLCDYGAFRDLQRHRPLTIEWQRLTPELGYDVPEAVDRGGLAGEWDRAMAVSRETWEALEAARAARRRAVRGVDGLPDPVRDADDRARGDAPHRAPLPAHRPPGLPAGRPGDARGHRGGPSGDRRRRSPTSATTTSTWSAWRPSAAPRPSAQARRS